MSAMSRASALSELSAVKAAGSFNRGYLGFRGSPEQQFHGHHSSGMSNQPVHRIPPPGVSSGCWETFHGGVIDRGRDR